jgi:hypothetical protein
LRRHRLRAESLPCGSRRSAIRNPQSAIATASPGSAPRCGLSPCTRIRRLCSSGSG